MLTHLSRENEGLVSPRLATACMILIVVAASIPAALATPAQIQSAPATSKTSAATPEVVAAADSKGRIHAAWVERSGRSGGLGNARLWYSTYDPEMIQGRSTRLVESSASIYSLDMTIDKLDNVHMVWVSTSTSVPETWNQSRRFEARYPVNAVYYLSAKPTGTSLGSPQLILDSKADAVWASITSGYDSTLYLAWSEVLRANSTEMESSAYYTRLSMRGAAVSIDPTLVTRIPGSSRMLKATSLSDRKSLYLAWIEEPVEGRSRIMYSRVDVMRNVTAAIGCEDVDGSVSGLTLRETSLGEVVMGWAYQERSQSQPGVRLATLPREEGGKVAGVNLRLLDYPGRPESMTLDSQGNLHLVWVERGEDVRATARPIRVSESRIYYVEIGGSGGGSEQKREVFPLPVETAFVVDGGQLYAVSQDGLLEAVKPISTNNPLILLFTLIVSAALVSGLSTEAGVYLVARWKAIPLRKDLAILAPGNSVKLLRKIKNHPGVTLSELKSVIPGTMDLASNLRMLEATGVIHSIREGTKRRFYHLTSVDQRESHVDNLRRSIINFVRDNPGVTEAQIARHLELTQQLANYHLRLLREARLLWAFRVRGKVSYVVNERILRGLRGERGAG